MADRNAINTMHYISDLCPTSSGDKMSFQAEVVSWRQQLPALVNLAERADGSQVAGKLNY